MKTKQTNNICMDLIREVYSKTTENLNTYYIDEHKDGYFVLTNNDRILNQYTLVEDAFKDLIYIVEKENKGVLK